jgi:hypothetical protein
VAGIPGYVLRAQWGYALQPGDIVVFTVDPPQSDKTLRGVVAIAVAAAYTFYTYDAQTGLQIGNLVAGLSVGLTVSNLLLPPTLPEAQNNQQSAQNVFSTSISGNQAKLDQPIWKVCGRRKITPPFAAEPYLEYLDTIDGLDCDQYYYALFAIGEGNHELNAFGEVERALIGGTPIKHYSDVIVSQYLAPGVQPSQVKANVSNCAAVSGSVLESGRYVGGFAACRPGRVCASIGIDIVAPRGLGKGGAALTVAWRVETRAINDFGTATGPWSILGTGSKTAATNTPQRWSKKFPVPSPGRLEVRVVRTDVKDEDTTAAHEIVWAGLRAYLAEPATLNPNVAHYEVVLRASDQLSQLAQRDVGLIVTGKCRTWSPGGGWGPQVATRNAMWWLADLLTNANWGGGYPDARVDLQSIYELSLTADARQDRFDWVFDTAMTLWDAAQLIARSCRARVFRRNGVFTVARDELATLPVTAFTHRNCMPGSMVISEKLPTNDTPDGFVIEFEDNRTWLWTSVDCPAPGVTTMVNPVRKRIEGITGPTHAQREGLYEAANLAYRSRTTTCKTEMQGVLPAYMSPVRWQPEIFGYGQSGDVAFWDSATRVMGLTEPPTWAGADLYLTLQRDDGSLTTPVLVTPGPMANDVVLPAAPDFTLVLDDGTRERPKYLLGAQVGGDEMVKVLAIADGGKGPNGEQLYDIHGVIDDVRVHQVDNALLPGPGTVQDPILSGDDVAGGAGDLILVNLNDVWLQFSNQNTEPSQTGEKRLSIRNTGKVAYWLGFDLPIDVSPDGYLTVSGQWVPGADIETSTAASFEVRITHTPGFDVYGNTTSFAGTVWRTYPLVGPIGMWENLANTTTWTLPENLPQLASLSGYIAKVLIEIRRVNSSEIASSANYTLTLNTTEGLGLGG